MGEFAAQSARDDDRQILTLSGDVDLVAVDGLVELGRRALADGARPLVLDLAAVNFIDSAGIGALIAVRNLAVEHDTTVVLRHAVPSVLRVLTIAGVTRIFDMEPDPDADA